VQGLRDLSRVTRRSGVVAGDQNTISASYMAIRRLREPLTDVRVHRYGDRPAVPSSTGRECRHGYLTFSSPNLLGRGFFETPERRRGAKQLAEAGYPDGFKTISFSWRSTHSLECRHRYSGAAGRRHRGGNLSSRRTQSFVRTTSPGISILSPHQLMSTERCRAGQLRYWRSRITASAGQQS